MSRSLKTATRIAILAASLCGCGRVNQAVAPAAVATLSLGGQTRDPMTSTVAFVSDDLIAIGRRPRQPGRLSGTLTAVQWRAGKLVLLKSKFIENYRGLSGLFPAGNGNFISTLQQPSELLSGDLSTITDLPGINIIPPVGGGTVVGVSSAMDSWKIYRLGPAKVLLRQGVGQLLSLSDDLVVLRFNDQIRIEKMTGQPIGSFAVPPPSTCSVEVLLLGPNRLYLNGCDPGRVVDFDGKTVIVLPETDGWGFRFGLTQDGRRLLFDRYTRRISVRQRMAESVESVLTLGMAPMVSSKGEMIRIVDTNTGKVCFELDTPDHQFGIDGGFHADVAPSGRFVAIASADRVSIYPLPVDCK